MDLTKMSKEDLVKVRNDLDPMLFGGYDQPWGSKTQSLLVQVYESVEEEIKTR